MANPAQAIAKLFKPGIEGRYSNDPHDTGGQTYCGIARNHHPEWIGWGEIDRAIYRQEKLNNDSLFNRLLPLLQSFYRSKFWLPIQGDSITDQPLANFLFSCAVNQGTGQAVKLLQRAIGTKADGELGPKTLLAINNGGDAVLGRFAEEVRAFYQRIAIGENARFLKGWLNRVAFYVSNDGFPVA